MKEYCAANGGVVGSSEVAKVAAKLSEVVGKRPERTETPEEAAEREVFDEPPMDEEEVPWESQQSPPKERSSNLPPELPAPPPKLTIVRPKDQQRKVNEIKSVLGPKGTYRREDLCGRCQRMGSPACTPCQTKFKGKTLLR